MLNPRQILNEHPQVLANAKALSSKLQSLGHKIVSDGTDNHIVLLDLRPKGIGE